MKLFLIQVITKIINRFFPNRVYLMRTGLAKGLNGTGGFQFIPRIKKESSENRFIKSIDFKNKIVFDIGAAGGMFTLFFARAVHPNGKVFSFEPNPFSYKELLGNLAVNNFNNIQTFQLGVGSSEYKDYIVFDKSSRGTGSLNKKIQAGLTNNSKVTKEEINVVSVDYFILNKGFTLPDFIKIDVEGLEFDVLEGMRNTLKNKKPELFIELHGATMEEKEVNILKIVKLLKNYKYDIKHVETDEIINIENSIQAKHGHIYCS